VKQYTFFFGFQVLLISGHQTEKKSVLENVSVCTLLCFFFSFSLLWERIFFAVDLRVMSVCF
jgi:hypothetical protein